MSIEAEQSTTGKAAAVGSGDWLESVKRYDQFTYWNDGPWTVVGDFDCNIIGRFTRMLTDREVSLWCDGYEIGVEQGRRSKAAEIKRVLGL